MKKGFPYFPRPASFAINGNFCTCDRRNFFCIRDRRIWSSRSTEFWNFAIDGIFVFAIDGILLCSRSTECLFRDRRIKRSNQAIESSDQRIKRSIVLWTLKICDREFSRNWYSGIPGKRSENKKKISFHQAHNGAPKDLFQGLFSSPTQICLRRKSNEPFLNSCMGNTLQRGPEGIKKKSQHITVPSVPVDMGTLLQLAWVSMLPCCAHVKKDQKYASLMRKWHERYLVP